MNELRDYLVKNLISLEEAERLSKELYEEQFGRKENDKFIASLQNQYIVKADPDSDMSVEAYVDASGFVWTSKKECDKTIGGSEALDKDQILGYLYDIANGKSNSYSKSDLLQKYKELTGKEKPEFM